MLDQASDIPSEVTVDDIEEIKADEGVATINSESGEYTIEIPEDVRAFSEQVSDEDNDATQEDVLESFVIEELLVGSLSSHFVSVDEDGEAEVVAPTGDELSHATERIQSELELIRERAVDVVPTKDKLVDGFEKLHDALQEGNSQEIADTASLTLYCYRVRFESWHTATSSTL